MKPLISVIIPVYNTEKYLELCLKSVLNQTFQKFEIIVVDDGSTDNSLSVVKNMLVDRVFARVVSQQNCGVSAARNYGMSLAKGKYITFVDSDDFVDADYLQNMACVTENDDFDFVMSGISLFKEEYKIYESQILPDRKFFFKDCREWLDIASMKLITSPVSKLYKTELILKSGLLFDKSKCHGEDRDFNVKYLSLIKNAVSLSTVSYCYRRDVVNSLTKKYYKDRLLNDIDYWNKLKNLFVNKTALIESEKYLATRLFWFIVDDSFEKKKNEGVVSMIKSLLESRKLFDRSLLIKNIKIINAPIWLKFLVALCYR